LGYHIIQEIEELERRASILEEISKRPKKESHDITHGYAFSQSEGQQKLLALAPAFLSDPFKLLVVPYAHF
jgi:hypothetical protein